MRLSDQMLGTHPNSWPRFLLSFVSVIILYLLIAVLIGAIGFLLIVAFEIDTMGLEGMLIEGRSPLSIIASFGSIAILHLALWPILRIVYRRKYLTLVNPLHYDWKLQAKWGLIYTFGFLLAGELFAWIFWGPQISTHLVWQPLEWVVWIVPIAVIVFLQITAEELLVRGFMQQYLARLVSHRWVYIGVPAAFWAALHYWNYENLTIAIPVTTALFALGIVLGDWADRTTSLVGPIVVHFANNLFLVAIYGNTLEPSSMNIWEMDASALADNQVGLWGAVSAVAMIVVYIPIRKYLRPQSRQDA